MKDLGSLCYFLGIEVVSSSKGYLLSQSKYTTDLFDLARLTSNMIADIPLNAKAKYIRANGDLLHAHSLYRTFFGSLVYLTMTCPDITYGVHIVGQFADALTTINWAVILRILKYLQGTRYLMLFILFHTLLFPFTSSLDLRAYCDIDWADDFVAWKSITVRVSCHGCDYM
uniref:Mitochondrial protein n=1 Tax=Tanacetum cinerariifolium TaxID=118510 RepID=A0A699IMS1_TANCI|nr:hypothetical protein [Tanacetum cinerariifolium]